MHYMPVLRDKTAELKSLTLLGQPTAIDIQNLWPLVEAREPQSEDAVKNVLKSISASLTTSPCQHFLVDLYEIDTAFPALMLNEGPSRYSPVEYLAITAHSRWTFTPVIAMNSSSVTLQAAAKAHKMHQAGVAIRLDFEDFDSDDFDAQLEAVLTAIELPKSQLHIILNIGFVAPENISKDKKAVVGTLAMLPHRTEWASITLVGAAYPPRNPENVAPGSVTPIPRSDWMLFSQIYPSAKDLSYGDYGIENIAEAAAPKGPFASGNLRYTVDSNWLFVKGKLITKGGYDYMSDVYAITFNLPEFSGAAYSWGDAYINDCVNGKGGPGNATIWRQIAITHHITFVLKQVNQLKTGGSAMPF